MSTLTPEGSDVLRDEYMGDEEIPLGSIVRVGDSPDGGSIFEIVSTDDSGDDTELSSEGDFYENLAEKIPTPLLNKLATNLIQAIDQDKDSRQDWEQCIVLVMNYLGIKVEEFKNFPREFSSAAYDTTLMAAVINTFSIAQAELFPAAGPAKSKILGNPNEKIEDQGDRIAMFLNHFLTDIDEDFYPSHYHLLMYAICMGSAFTKMEMNPIGNQPRPRIVKPQDLIIDVDCTSILSSSRITHQYTLSKKEVILRQRSGAFIEFPTDVVSEEEDAEFSEISRNVKRIEGISKEDSDTEFDDEELYFYECDVDLDEDDINGKFKSFGESENKLPKPYIVTIFKNAKKVVSIRRNWKNEDEKFDKINRYVVWNYLTGFGVYGLGLFHTLGQSAIVATTILRQNIDAGTAKVFPGGMIKAGLKLEDNVKAPGPGEFVRVETAEPGPIENGIMLMPYPGPLAEAISILEMVKRDAGRTSAVLDNQVPDGSSNTPAITTLITSEIANRNLSTVLRSFHNSLGKVLKLLFNLFKENLEDGTPYPFAVSGGEYTIMKEDFNNYVSIVPVSDPNVITSTHRLLRDEALMKLAESAPQLYDMRAIHKRICRAMKIDDIDSIMPPPEEVVPMDPITENMHMTIGKAAKVGIEQDHESHLIVHSLMAGNSVADAHMKEHQAAKFLVEMQMAMGMQMPDAQMLLNPQVQNEIALKAAQVAQQMLAQQQEQAQKPQMDQNAVLMAQIEQEREAAHLKYETDMARIELDKQKVEMQTETEAFKTQMDFEKEMTKTDASKEIAEERNQTSLEIANMKNRGI